MSDTKFTKGEWLPMPCEFGEYYGGSKHYNIDGVAYLIKSKEDAHLISAARDMYKELCSLLFLIERMPEDSFGYVPDSNDEQGYFIRDAAIYGVSQTLKKARGEL